MTATDKKPIPINESPQALAIGPRPHPLTPAKPSCHDVIMTLSSQKSPASFLLLCAYLPVIPSSSFLFFFLQGTMSK